MSTARERRKLPGSDAASERHHGFRAVGVAVSQLAAPIIAKRGGVLVRLRVDWSTIVGPQWALPAWPMALAPGGVLKLRTIPAAALELQHRAPLLIDCINRYFGRAAVTRLVLMQGPLPHGTEPRGCEPGSRTKGGVEMFDPRLSRIDDPGLRAALGRLAEAVAAAG